MCREKSQEVIGSVLSTLSRYSAGLNFSPIFLPYQGEISYHPTTSARLVRIHQPTWGGSLNLILPKTAQSGRLNEFDGRIVFFSTLQHFWCS